MQYTILILHCFIAILISGLSQFFLVIFSTSIGSYDSLVLYQYESCLILSRNTCMHWRQIIENAYPCCFYNYEFLSQYVCRSFLCSILESTSRTMGRMCWLEYLASTILLLRKAKENLYLAAMVGSTSMTSSSKTSLWNWHDSSRRYYDWYFISVSNWCSSNISWVFSILGMINVFSLSNYLLMSCPYIFQKLCTSFYHVVLIWYDDSFWP